MKKLCLVLLLLGVIVGAGLNTCYANVFTFAPIPADMNDLDHYHYYTWGIDWQIPANDKIIGASLSFDNIFNHNWDNHVLYVHLLDSVAVGLTEYYDAQGWSNAFSGQGVELFTAYNQMFPPAHDFTYNFTLAQVDTLVNYLADGNFGLGLDPDCHFYNDGVKLKIITAVPEPLTMLLFGPALLGLVGLKRKRS